MSKRKNNNRKTKKEAVLKTNKSKLNPMVVVLCISVAFIVTVAAMYITDPSNPHTDTASTAAAGTSRISYPISMFEDGSARHFEYKADDLNIRYFILKSSDGVIRSAFDACDVCWPAGKGYYQDEDDMVCRNCGRRFASVLVNEVKGGCNPAPLNRRVDGDTLILKTEDILQGKTYFNFKKKA